jgi:transposase-like protein
VCVEYVARLQWPDGPVCPSCGGTEHSYLSTRRVWKCRACKRQFSVKVGTIFEQSPIGLDKWLPAVWLLANSKNGVSSHELGRAIGITQKSAWHVMHRVREAMKTGTVELLDGVIEVDETFIGGLAENMHDHKRAQRHTGRGNRDKAIVVGARQRGGEVRARVVPDRKKHSLLAFVQNTVDPGAQVYTDEANAYLDLRWEGYKHASVNHSKKQYVNGNVSTNGVENFWALLKRGIHGTYVQVSDQHLHRYVDERAFTYNLRERTDLERFETALERSVGRRVTWADLTN